MIHALPGQDSYHYLNLKPKAYWVSHLSRRRAVVLEEDTPRIRDLAKRNGARYMVKRGLVFVNQRRI